MVKTITIMDDAYDILKKMKTGDESFSDVIRKVGKSSGTDLTKWLGILKSDSRSIEELRHDMKKIREKTSKDIEERMNRLKRQMQ